MLRKGSSGQAVIELQDLLCRHGFALRGTGIFADATDAAVRKFQSDHGLEVDGIAGPDTFAALRCGADESAICQAPPAHLPATLAGRVARVRGVTRQGIRYKLARGGKSPRAALPGLPGDPAADESIGCDCSGFAAWGFGLSRGPLPNPPPAWFETTQIYRDATGPRRMFRQISEPVPGCLVVYPDRDGHQGHVGIVTETAPALRGVDCSSSRSSAIGEAITERGFEFFKDKGAIFALLVTDPNG